MAWPTAAMASITSSTGMALCMPARAMIRRQQGDHRAAGIAFDTGNFDQAGNRVADQAQQVFQGQCRSMADLLGVAAQQVYDGAGGHGCSAEPHSAWQPPSAPDREAREAMTMPITPATPGRWPNRREETLRSSAMANKTAGSIPLEPAVGAAQILPMAALASLAASA
jgi:hypothetical protein